jgi:putative ABC transport system substrate-binding protein
VAQQPRAGYAVLLEELGRLGFVEDRNLSVDPRGFGLSVELLEATAVEVARTQPDAIFAGGDAAARAAQRATTSIPIVAIADDVIRNRLASSLARPAGNLTGISILASELNGKWLVARRDASRLRRAGALSTRVRPRRATRRAR